MSNSFRKTNSLTKSLKSKKYCLVKNLLKYILFIVSAVVIFFILANFILYYAWGRRNDELRIYQWDPYLIYSLKPNLDEDLSLAESLRLEPLWKKVGGTWHLKTNSLGIRAKGEIPAKSKNHFRILALGDSITFGLAINDEETYPVQLEEILQRIFPAPVKVEVINAGVTGYSSRQGLVYLREKLLFLKPDLVIIGFGVDDSAIKYLFSDQEIMKGDIHKGFKKIYYSPTGLLTLLVLRQPLFIFLRGLIANLRMAHFTKKLGEKNLPLKEQDSEAVKIKKSKYLQA